MASRVGSDSEEEDDDDIGLEEGFQHNLDALKRACLLNIGQDSFLTAGSGSGPGTPSSALEEDDEELFQSIQKKYSVGCLYLDKDFLTQRRPAINSDDEEEDDEDDDEILRSVEKLYGANERSKLSERKEDVHENADVPGAETRSLGCSEPEEISSEDVNSERVLIRPAKDLGRAVSAFLPSNWNNEEDPEFDVQSPLSAVVPFDPYNQHVELLSSAAYEELGSADKEKIIAEALQKNQSFQQRMRIILGRIESKQKHNAEMQRRVRTLAEFEKYCKRRYAGCFTDQANPSLKLFSVRGERREASEKNDCHPNGPPDNPDVEAYRMLKQKAMFTSLSGKWRVDERRELAKGVKQQVYEVLVCEAMDALSNGDVTGDCALEDALNDIRSKELTPQDIRDAIGEVSWDDIARVYVVNRTAEECRTRWFNHEDPLINKSSWTKIEDKKLLSIAQRNNETNWEKIALELGSKRTPAECLVRYQRSLNASIMRSNWSPEEDDKLRAAVEELGESDWSAVAACLEGRNNSQCLMRWYKVLHPAKNRKGRWSVEEDKRLKWAVSVYGARKWKQIAEHVPGRTDIQCRERWCNVLNPDIKVDVWTEEEDKILRESIARHGPHHWSLISADLKVRTDKQCWRRWKILFPEHQSDYQRNVFIQRNALVKNFQGRRKERPKLGPQDFVSKSDTLVVPSQNVKKKRIKGKSAKASSVQVRSANSAGHNSTPAIAASDRRDSDRSVRGALQEVRVNGDDVLSDPKLRRLARIHKLRLARANKLVSNVAKKVPPAASRSKVSSRNNSSGNGREEASDIPASVKERNDKGKRRLWSKSYKDQGKPTKRPRHDVAKQSMLDDVRSDTESAPQTGQVPESILTRGETEPLAAGVITSVAEGPAEIVTNTSTLEKERGRSRKRLRLEICPGQGQPTKGARSRRASPVPAESQVQIMSQAPQLVRPGPEVLAFVDLVHAVNDFCKCSSLVCEEQRISTLPGSEISNMAVVISAEDTSGGWSSSVGDKRTNYELETYPRSAQDHGQPTVGTECLSAKGAGSAAERRMVPSMAIAGGTRDAVWCPNSCVNRASVLSVGGCDATVEIESNTNSTGRGAEENVPNPVSGWSTEDEEVSAATKAILSWPFFYGVQQLMFQATEFLDAKTSRKKPAARFPKASKKRKTLDVSPASQLATSQSQVTANACPVPRRPRSARRRVKMRGSVQGTDSDVDRALTEPSNSVGALEPVVSADK